ncbi:MAG: type II toxin-antitoxin system RelE/ParE family toxin [Acidobacteriia bacterium]|nr:type II toxin-antitoxin system RelE/ParE family toxin [Terriglobia bacterium]
MTAEANPRTLRYYQTADGIEPFRRWIRKLKDERGRAKIQVRLDRVEDGNFGDCGPEGEGVSALRIDFGPGYRVYFGEDGYTVVLLLGGDKSSQVSDIKKAREYWRDYNA